MLRILVIDWYIHYLVNCLHWKLCSDHFFTYVRRLTTRIWLPTCEVLPQEFGQRIWFDYKNIFIIKRYASYMTYYRPNSRLVYNAHLNIRHLSRVTVCGWRKTRCCHISKVPDLPGSLYLSFKICFYFISVLLFLHF